MNSFIKWIGGKRLLRKKIIEEFPDKSEYDRYIEVFGGAGWVLFAKEPGGMEVYNDANGELANLFRIVKYHPEALQKELQFTLNSFEQFHNWKNQLQVQGMTDVQRAARFYVVIRYSYGANLKNYSGRELNIKKGIAYIGEISERLNKVIIENKDFERILNVYDRKDALFYLDPPYHGTEKYYQAQFADADHERLFRSLSEIKGKFILSYNNDDFIKELYKDFKIIPVSRRNGLLERYDLPEKMDYKELIIKNY